MFRPLMVALAVGACGLLYVAWGFTNPGSRCDNERHDAYWLEDASPPGAVRCQGHREFGAHYEWVVLPWVDWATVVAVALAAGLLAAAWRGRSIGRAGGAVLLFAAGVVAWFFGSAVLSWSLVAVAAAAALALSRSAGTPRTAR
ncbi:MAG TPA: hypothetical protein VGW10_05085 [Solirubrobacteraceae bacterium]|nr:hypothetical protein [Solirubrobacteraceae bacterium]